MRTQRMIDIGRDVRVGLLLEGERFDGIGEVTVGGVRLRAGERPVTVALDTPEGYIYPRLELAGVEAAGGGGSRVRLRAIGVPWGRAEYQDDYGQPIVWLRDDAGPVEDELALTLKPASLELGGREWRGFGYSFRFASASRRIHRLMTLATWEIGGRITGNTVLSQGLCNRPVWRGAKESAFTTECIRTLDQYGSPQGHSYQLGPRGGLPQAFDFQYSREGALLQLWPEHTSVSSLVESPPGSDLLHVVDEYRFPLSGDVTTPAKHVLFAPGSLEEHEARDLWWEAHEHVHGRMRGQFGVRPTVVMPEVGMPYTVRVDGQRLLMTVAGAEVESPEVPYAVADRLLPRLAESGVTRFFPEVMSESDVTILGMRRKLDDGVHSDLHCASVCATHRFFPSEFWGGIKAWRYMYDRARALKIELGCWFAPHISPRARVFREHPDWQMLDATGMPAGGGYGFHCIVVADWNTGFYDWAFADMKRWKEEGGLDYVFTDSMANMGLVQVSYANDMRTNIAALGRFLADLQRIGIPSLSFECISQLGYGRIGCADPRGDLPEKPRGPAGQSDFGWWIGDEDMAYGLCIMPEVRHRSDAELERAAFRAAAARGHFSYQGIMTMAGELPAWWVGVNRRYARAAEHMKRRRLLPGGAGVEWRDGDTRVIWTFKEHGLDLPAGARVEVIEGKGSRELAAGNAAPLPAWGVYVVTPSAERG